MPIIDVDAHAELALDWLDEFPSLKARFPDLLPDTDPRFRLGTAEMFAYFVSDDVLRQVPPEDRMPIDRIVTPAMQYIFDAGRDGDLVYKGSSQYAELTDPAARVAWLDAQGIDKQNVITGGGYTLARVIEDPVLGMEALEAANTWMAGAIGDHGDRLLPVTNLRFDDLDWVVREMTRMRERGSRTFLISSEPVNRITPADPAFDRVWSAATDLGMVALLHVGMAPAMIHPGWAYTDNPALIRILSVLQPAQSAEILLNALVFGGVFERHPELTVLLSEVGIDWFRPAVRRMDGTADPAASPLVLGDHSIPLKPSEYVERNVRISPLPAPYQSPIRILDDFPRVAVFSSDYPHFEGNGDPIGYYDKALASVDTNVRDGFLGGNIAESFARMGDPL